MITLCQVEGLIQEKQFVLARSIVREMDISMDVKNAVCSEIFKAELVGDAEAKKDGRQDNRVCMIKKWHSLFKEVK